MNSTLDETRPTGMKAASAGRRDMYDVDPRTIKVRSNWNKRDFTDPENIAHIESLAASIATVGVLNPIIVRYEQGAIILADGECRLRATLLAIERGADIPTIQAVPEKRGVDDASQIAAQGTRNMGKQMTDLEFARICADLVGFNWSVERIAKTMGKSEAWVEGKLTLAEAPTAVKTLIKEGTVAAGTVVKLATKEGMTAASEAVQKAATPKTKGAEPKRVTAKVLEARGGMPPTKTYSREEARGAVAALKAILALSSKSDLDDAQTIATNFLESVGAL